MLDADGREYHIVLHAHVEYVVHVALRREHCLGLDVYHGHRVVRVDADRRQEIAGGGETERLDALSELALYRRVLKLHGDRIPDADHRLRSDLPRRHQSLIRRERDGRHIVDVARHETLRVRRGVVGDAQACRMIDEVLVLPDADIVSGIMAAVAMNPHELQLHLRRSVLLHGWLNV